jgi:glycosyltransferase involved in cell wall biosynthesis
VSPAVSSTPSLSVLIPVYNEKETILPLLERVRSADAGIPKQVLVGDDGSTDGTREMLQGLNDPAIELVLMPSNRGRGGVIKALWPRVTGDFVIHQDADLEYDPNQYAALLAPLLDGTADVVYGSRFKGSISKMRPLNNLGNRVMTGVARALYGIRISDLMTCYKLYRRQLVEDLAIEANGFHFEAELTARLAQRGARFSEVPVSFVGRSFAEGKKIRSRDALWVIQKLVASRFSRP